MANDRRAKISARTVRLRNIPFKFKRSIAGFEIKYKTEAEKAKKESATVAARWREKPSINITNAAKPEVIIAILYG